jgi:hypothetical protein
MLQKETMLRSLRVFLLVLLAFAFIGGASAQFARSADYAPPMMMSGVPCDLMMSHPGIQADKPMPPCKGVTSDCIKSLGCVSDTALPMRTMRFDIASNVSGVHYWSAWSSPAGFVCEPEPLPPRTI